MDVIEPVPSVCREAGVGVVVEGGERGSVGDRVCEHTATSSVEPKKGVDDDDDDGDEEEEEEDDRGAEEGTDAGPEGERNAVAVAGADVDIDNGVGWVCVVRPAMVLKEK